MFSNLAGKEFGRLKVISQGKTVLSAAGNPRSRWLCVCSCGASVTVDTAKLNNGHTKSCGCLYRESRKTCNVSHGMRKTRTYRIYAGIKNRCNNSKDSKYHLWGGRGITVCKEWQDSFTAFFADMGEAPEGKSIDRINNELGYFKDNCRWATPMEQANNLRTTLRFSCYGLNATISEWADLLGVSRNVIKLRLKHSDDFTEIVERVVKKYGKTEKLFNVLSC